MATYLPRVADGLVRDALGTFGAVILEGPRAVGKTSLGQQLAASSIRMDSSPQLVDLADTAPNTVLEGPVPRLVDEWQLAPALWNAVRHEVDRRGQPGQFILTGSATPADDVTRHSGAGRFRRVLLRPMSLVESGESIETVPFDHFFSKRPGAESSVAGVGGPSIPDYAELIIRGGWPALVTDPRRSAGDYLRAYLSDIARVGLVDAGMAVDPVRMQALLRVLARNIATEIAATRLAAEAGIGSPENAHTVSAQTVRRHLDALTRVFVVEEQPAWAPHLRSRVRLRVQPKWHFIDPSLACAALGADAQRLVDDPETLGLLFESLCVRDLRVHADARDGQVFHYRDGSGLEVDAIVELHDGRWAAFEVKLGGTAAVEGASRNLHKLRAKIAESRAANLCSLNVLTAGETSYTRADGVNVVALGHLAA